MLFPFKNSYTSNKFVDVACWKRNKCDIYYEVYYRWFLWFKKKKSNFINQWVWIYKSITSDWKVMINDHIKKIKWLTVTWSIIYTCLALEFFLCLGPKSKKNLRFSILRVVNNHLIFFFYFSKKRSVDLYVFGIKVCLMGSRS